MSKGSVTRGIIVIASAALLAATAGSPSRTAHAQAGCTLGSFVGPYGYALNGSYYDTNGYLSVYANAGRLISDGNGTLTSGADTQNDDGAVSRRTYTGSYAINSDCTGSIVLRIGNAAAHGDIVLVNGGKELNFIQTDANVIFSGVMKAQ